MAATRAGALFAPTVAAVGATARRRREAALRVKQRLMGVFAAAACSCASGEWRKQRRPATGAPTPRAGLALARPARARTNGARPGPPGASLTTRAKLSASAGQVVHVGRRHRRRHHEARKIAAAAQAHRIPSSGQGNHFSAHSDNNSDSDNNTQLQTTSRPHCCIQLCK